MFGDETREAIGDRELAKVNSVGPFLTPPTSMSGTENPPGADFLLEQLLDTAETKATTSAATILAVVL